MTLILSALLWFVFRGLVEGMVMVMPGDAMYRQRFNIDGVRSHRWFKQYHILVIIRDIFLALSCVTLINCRDLSWTFLTTLSGTIILGWAIFEATYSFSRYARWIPEQENVLGTGRYVHGNVWLVQLVRLVVGAALIVWRFV